MKVQTVEKTVNAKLQFLQDAEKEPEANTVLHKVTANLRLLEDVLNLVNKDVDNISNQIITAELTDAQAKELTDRITNLVKKSNSNIAILKVNLLHAKAALRATASATLSPFSEGSIAGSSILAFQSELAKHLAEIKAASEKDKSSPPKNINNFGYSKIQVPEFSGNV